MPQNIELKARLRDFVAAIATAERLCGPMTARLDQTDTYFFL